ncbi:MAG: hypothetical protein EZS28_013577 [Streblomastix strix]|uniref:Uncharacterized protein n=1 Tax=Streblomastix strix TaxID=222440 RepID=A0A5J4W7Q2_9EUKA|nr:MAG: hypothetical protein EZS28_013577 [Streblomastix strix]
MFDGLKKDMNYTIEEFMTRKIPFIDTEFMIWYTKTKKTKQSSEKCHAIVLYTMFSLIFGTVQVYATAQ